MLTGILISWFVSVILGYIIYPNPPETKSTHKSCDPNYDISMDPKYPYY